MRKYFNNFKKIIESNDSFRPEKWQRNLRSYFPRIHGQFLYLMFPSMSFKNFHRSFLLFILSLLFIQIWSIFFRKINLESFHLKPRIMVFVNLIKADFTKFIFISSPFLLLKKVFFQINPKISKVLANNWIHFSQDLSKNILRNSVSIEVPLIILNKTCRFS